MEIDTLEGVQLGGITQWIRVRGADASNPVLLLMQQGPGLPLISDRQRLERDLRLEDDFTVVYWDQRGTGLAAPSLRRNSNRFEISVAGNGGRHGCPVAVASRPVRCEDIRHRVLLRRDLRRL